MKSKRKLIAAFHYNYTAAIAIKYLMTKRKWWVRPAWRRRSSEGAYEKLVKCMRHEDTSLFKTFLRVTPDEFKELKHLVSPYIRKFPAGRKALSPGHRLAVTLRYLASGDSITSIAFLFRIGIATVSKIIKEVCMGLWQALRKRVLPKPTQETWRNIAEGYESKWNYPNCVGSVDGKHIKIEAPPNSGTKYFNYKRDFSIILMAVVDSEYKFVLVDVGAYGSNSDGGVWKNSAFGKDFDSETVELPPPRTVCGFGTPLPYVLIGDEGFQLRKNFLRPFSGCALNNERRIFNYRLSRARRCVENAFGIMASRWRILRRAINLKPDTTDTAVLTCVVLHNYLMTSSSTRPDSGYNPIGYSDHILPSGEIVEGHWRDFEVNLEPIGPTSSRNHSRRAETIRNEFMEYFNTVGAVSWQNESAHIHVDC